MSGKTTSRPGFVTTRFVQSIDDNYQLAMEEVPDPAFFKAERNQIDKARARAAAEGFE